MSKGQILYEIWCINFLLGPKISPWKTLKPEVQAKWNQTASDYYQKIASKEIRFER